MTSSPLGPRGRPRGPSRWQLAREGLAAGIHRRLHRLFAADLSEREQPTPLDLRLLLPAVSGWAVLALTVALPVTTQLVILCGVLALQAVMLAWATVRRRRGRARGREAGRNVPRARRLLHLLLALLTVLQAASLTEGLRREHGELIALREDRAHVRLVGRVTLDPVERSAGPAGLADRPRWMLRVAAEQVSGRGRLSPAHGPVLLTGGSELAGVRWNARIVAEGLLRAPPPGSSDVAVLAVRGPPQERTTPGVVATVAATLRAGLRTAVDTLPQDARGLVPGLVIGDTSRTPASLTEAMRATGLTHLVAVSGSNVAVVLALAIGLCALLGLPRGLRPWVAAAALAGFIVLARPEPSVVRAGAMGAIGLIGLARGGRASGPPILAGAIIVILALDPWMARSYGFALSTLATLGLLLFVRPWGRAIGRLLPRRLSGFGPALAIPVAAQLMCAPVLVLLQPTVSIIGVLANLLAAPLVAPATIAGVATAMTAPISDVLAARLAWCAGLPALGIAAIARRLEGVPLGTLPWPDGAGGALLLCAVTVLALLTGPWLWHQAQRRPLALAWSAGMLLAMFTPTRVVTWPPADWQVVFCDVGQGDGTVLRTGAHAAVVIDVGPDPAAIRECLDRLAIREVPLVLLTHFHADHVGGLPGVLDSRPVGQVLTTPIEQPAEFADAVTRWVHEGSVPLGRVAAGDALTVGDLSVRVWAPARRIEAGSVPNNASLVLAVETGTVRLLILGDIEREAGRDLDLRIARDPAMALWAQELTVVRTPHHGSANFDPALINRLRAPVAVISVGADNTYGHPSRSQIEAYRAGGARVLRTDRDGDIAVVEDLEGVHVSNRMP